MAALEPTGRSLLQLHSDVSKTLFVPSTRIRQQLIKAAQNAFLPADHSRFLCHWDVLEVPSLSPFPAPQPHSPCPYPRSERRALGELHGLRPVLGGERLHHLPPPALPAHLEGRHPPVRGVRPHLPPRLLRRAGSGGQQMHKYVVHPAGLPCLRAPRGPPAPRSIPGTSSPGFWLEIRRLGCRGFPLSLTQRVCDGSRGFSPSRSQPPPRQSAGRPAARAASAKTSA